MAPAGRGNDGGVGWSSLPQEWVPAEGIDCTALWADSGCQWLTAGGVPVPTRLRPRGRRTRPSPRRCRCRHRDDGRGERIGAVGRKSCAARSSLLWLDQLWWCDAHRADTGRMGDPGARQGPPPPGSRRVARGRRRCRPVVARAERCALHLGGRSRRRCRRARSGVRVRRGDDRSCSGAHMVGGHRTGAASRRARSSRTSHRCGRVHSPGISSPRSALA